MDKDFFLFQKHFKRYQKLFNLLGYRVYFKQEPIEGEFANITINQGEMVATVRFNSHIPDEDKPNKDIRRSAKHEALHLLIGRLELNGFSRFTSENEISEASEELVFKLEELIDG